jgi:hypothetical protein
MHQQKIRPLIGLSLISFSLLGFSPLSLAQNTTPTATKAPIEIKGLHTTNTIDGEYIVVFNPDVNDATIDKIRRNINQQNSASNTRSLHRFSRIKGFAGKIAPGQLKKLVTIHRAA